MIKHLFTTLGLLAASNDASKEISGVLRSQKALFLILNLDSVVEDAKSTQPLEP